MPQGIAIVKKMTIGTGVIILATAAFSVWAISRGMW